MNIMSQALICSVRQHMCWSHSTDVVWVEFAVKYISVQISQGQGTLLQICLYHNEPIYSGENGSQSGRTTFQVALTEAVDWPDQGSPYASFVIQSS